MTNWKKSLELRMRNPLLPTERLVTKFKLRFEAKLVSVGSVQSVCSLNTDYVLRKMCPEKPDRCAPEKKSVEKFFLQNQRLTPFNTNAGAMAFSITSQ